MSNIKATFPAGVAALTVHGLHQWDYGRQLEIAHPDLPAMLEVHFANAASREAVVRVVPGINGVAQAAIPDVLLEQTLPITAWVYVIGAASGETMLEVTMPITPRARPAASGSVPEEIGDKYTAAVDAVNAQVESLKMGNVMVASAANATHADRASEAENAAKADRATSDSKGRDIVSTYQTKDRGVFQPVMYFSPVSGKLYQFKVVIEAYTFYATVSWAPGESIQASLGWTPVPLGEEGIRYLDCALGIEPGSAHVWGFDPEVGIHALDVPIYFREI